MGEGDQGQEVNQPPWGKPVGEENAGDLRAMALLEKSSGRLRLFLE
jgi:hypothetical protein